MLLPDLSSAYCTYGGGVHIDTIGSVTLLGIPKGAERAKQEEKKGRRKGTNEMKGRNSFGKNQRSGAGSTAVSARTASPRDMDQATKKTKQNTR